MCILRNKKFVATHTGRLVCMDMWREQTTGNKSALEICTYVPVSDTRMHTYYLHT